MIAALRQIIHASDHQPSQLYVYDIDKVGDNVCISTPENDRQSCEQEESDFDGFLYTDLSAARTNVRVPSGSCRGLMRC